MRRLVCAGCGVGEDLTNRTGNIHTVQLVDLTPTWGEFSGPDKPVEEDLCEDCRNRIRRDFFGVPEPVLLEMPLMKGA